MNQVLEIVKDAKLTYHQKVVSLARAAENSIQVLNISEEINRLRREGIICDLFEGHAPYRPRYIVPDYARFLEQGSKFLGLSAPETLEDAADHLLILYKHVPSITTFPVYIGNLDELFEPFIASSTAPMATIKRFLRHIDRTITDSFCHGNLGPQETMAGRILLTASSELASAVPNLTLKYSDATSDAFALQAIMTALTTAKPSFANHTMFQADLGPDYAIASCYNGLPVGGGSYTLVRLNLHKLALQASNIEHFTNELLPATVAHMLQYLDERVRFIATESGFFESSFLAQEQLISQDKFTAMFGMVGLAECVNHLCGNPPEQGKRFGNYQKADDLGARIVEQLSASVANHHNEHLQASKGRYLLHAQVGIDTDKDTSPGCRIPIGDEPELYKHLMQSARFHRYFPAGIGDVFSFDTTVKHNPKYLLDLIKGAMKNGLRYFSAYSNDADVVRITGYLVKKSEMARLAKGQYVINSATVLGQGAAKNQRVLERKLRGGEF